MPSTCRHSYDLNLKLKIVAEVNNNHQFETDSKAKDNKYLSSGELSNKRFFSEPSQFFLEPTNQIKSMINVVCLLFIHLPVFIYILISVY